MLRTLPDEEHGSTCSVRPFGMPPFNWTLGICKPLVFLLSHQVSSPRWVFSPSMPVLPSTLPPICVWVMSVLEIDISHLFVVITFSSS